MNITFFNCRKRNHCSLFWRNSKYSFIIFKTRKFFNIN